MVLRGLRAFCLAFSVSPFGFINSFTPAAISFVPERTGPKTFLRASASARQAVASRNGLLSMRVTPKFVVSKEAAERLMKGPDKILMNIKTGEIISESWKSKGKPETPETATSKAGPGLLEPDIKLFCKAAADGAALGDCPFTHNVQMVLHFKNLPFQLYPCAPDKKPDWLVNDYQGKMPCLVDNGEAYLESARIVEYIEYFYPEPSLRLRDEPEKMAKAMEVSGGVFKALAECIKNLSKDKDAELVDAVMSELEKVDGHLKSTENPFLAGEQMTLADCSFAPKLYHASTCLAHFKNTVIPPELESLHKYMDMIYSHDTFAKSSYPPDVLVWGWNQARGTSAQ